MTLSPGTIVRRSPGQWDIIGHSHAADGGATITDVGMMHKTVKQQPAVIRNSAVGGAVASYPATTGTGDGGWYWAFKNYPRNEFLGAPYLARSGGVLIDFGINDYAKTGPTAGGSGATLSPGLVPMQNALKSMICRMKCAQIFENTHSSVAYGTGWAADGGFATGIASGDSYQYVPAASATAFTITTPADFPGGIVDIFFISAAAGDGAVFNVAVSGATTIATITGAGDSRNAGIFDYGSTRATTGKVNTYVYRTPTLNAGANTITVTPTTVLTNFFFDCWGIEAAIPPVIAVCLQFRPYGYGLWNSATWPYGNGGTRMTDAEVTGNVNPAIQSVVDGFNDPGHIFTIDLDSVIGKVQTNFISDQGHLNDKGHGIAAAQMLRVLEAKSFAFADLASPAVPLTRTWVPVAPNGGYAAGSSVNFVNGWQNIGSYYAPLTYNKDYLSGVVTIRGAISNTSTANVAVGAPLVVATLPVGYRPGYAIPFVVTTPRGPGLGEINTLGEIFMGWNASPDYNEFQLSYVAET